MMNTHSLSTLLIFIALLSIDCTNLAGGNGSETTNGYVAGLLKNENGSPATGARVMLITGAYDPVAQGPLPDSTIDTSDATGLFILKASEGTVYTIEAVQDSSGNRALVTKVTVIRNDTNFVLPVVIRKPGAVRLVGSITGNDSGEYLYIPGTTCFSEIKNGCALLDSVPAGTVPLIVHADRTGLTDDIVIAGNCVVSPGVTAIITDSSVWNYSKTLRFNTTGSGADVSGTVTDFPVLVRLRNTYFDFSQAQENGSDLRFAKNDGTPLPYEIERWDKTQQQAEIWVRVDTIRGNDSTQSIIMYWGNPDAADGSNSAAVFDAANNFQGVWHLAETANAMLHDATANGYDGTSSDTAPLPAPGAIGIAREFDGISNGIRMKGTASSTLNFPQNGNYTISAWVYSDTLDEKWHFIAGKGHLQYYLKQQIASRYGNWEFVEYHDQSAWEMTVASMTQRSWRLLVGVRSGDRQYTYLDGTLIDSVIKRNTDTDNTPGNTSDDFTIGRHQNFIGYADEGYCHFAGKIDEVRVSDTPRSADWLRLCFMNQREDDRLLEFK